jgi:hypothetical protein
MATLAHTKTPEQLAKEFHVNLSTGLSAAQAAEHQQKYGKNGASRDDLCFLHNPAAES